MSDETIEPGEPTSQVDISVLPWIQPAIGSDLLAYLLATDEEGLSGIISGELSLNAEQAGIVIALNQLKTALPEELDETTSANAVRGWLTQLGPESIVVARALHNHVINDEAAPKTHDDIQAALVTLALDSYAAFQLPPDPYLAKFMPEFASAFAPRPGIELSRLLIKHPQNIAFMAAVQEDATLKKAFLHQQEASGVYGMVYRNTGSGGTMQLMMLAQMLLAAGWEHLEKRDSSPSSFAVQVLKELQLVRDVFAGKQTTITAKAGLMGVLLPTPDTILTLPNGIVRSMTEEDRKHAPESLKGQLTGTDSSGTNTVINYDGDLVLEIQYPYKVRVVNKSMDEGPVNFPQDLQGSPVIEETLLRLRFSLMLAIERESRTQIVPTWRNFDEPFNAVGRNSSWSDPRQGTGIMPVQLTKEEVTKWSEWYRRLSTAHVARIELALSRILRALAERREPSDVLVDSVIAWENLFGTKEGEPTFRVSMCMAVLLEDSFEARTELQKKLKNIYSLRSKVVHGSGNLKVSEHPQCQEALEMAIRAIRVLTTTRTDILELADGAARSAALLLGSDKREKAVTDEGKD